MKKLLFLFASLAVPAILQATVFDKMRTNVEPLQQLEIEETVPAKTVSSKSVSEGNYSEWTLKTKGSLKCFGYVDNGDYLKLPFESWQLINGAELWERHDVTGDGTPQYQLRNVFPNSLTLQVEDVNPEKNFDYSNLGEEYYDLFQSLSYDGYEFTTGWKLTGSHVDGGEQECKLQISNTSQLRNSGSILLVASLWYTTTDGRTFGFPGAWFEFIPETVMSAMEKTVWDNEFVNEGNKNGLNVEMPPFAKMVKLFDYFAGSPLTTETLTTSKHIEVPGEDGQLYVLALYLAEDGKQVLDYIFLPYTYFLNATPDDWDTPKAGLIRDADQIDYYFKGNVVPTTSNETRPCYWQRKKSNPKVVRFINPYSTNYSESEYSALGATWDKDHDYYAIFDCSDITEVKTPQYPTPIKSDGEVICLYTLDYSLNNNTIYGSSTGMWYDLNVTPSLVTSDSGIWSPATDELANTCITFDFGEETGDDVKCVVTSVPYHPYQMTISDSGSFKSIVKNFEEGRTEDMSTIEFGKTPSRSSNVWSAYVDLTPLLPYGEKRMLVGALYRDGQTEPLNIFWSGATANESLPADLTVVSGKGNFYDVLFPSIYSGTSPRYFTVDVYKSESVPGWVWLKNPYKNSQCPYYEYSHEIVSPGEDTYLAFNVKNPEQVVMSDHETHLVWNSAHGALSMEHKSVWNSEKGEYVLAPATLTDDVITMPAGSIIGKLTGYSGYEWISRYDFTLALPAGAGVDIIETDSTDAQAEYYNLQGIKVGTPRPGEVYIEKRGSKATKVIFR